jgi:glucose/arabinose dehydrogenase
MKKLFTIIALFIGLSSVNAQYTTTNIITGLDYPVALDIAPDDRMFLTLKGGGNDPAANAKVEVYNGNGTLQAILWDFTDSAEIYFERGVLGVELDPDFNTNHYVYVFYNHKITTSRIRVVRFTESNGVGSNPTIIFDLADPYTAGNHTGGNIHFGPDGKLYISIGDRATTSNSQDITNNPFGKFLRLNADGTIPTDNPFYDDGNPAVGNDDRIWSYGHRNAFDFTFSSLNDSMYSAENGWNTWDEVNIIHKGGNYGWPTCEGFYNYNSTTTLCSMSSSVLPMEDWAGPPAVTGIVLYDHTLMPEFSNHLLVVDYNNGNITDFTLNALPASDVVTSTASVSSTSTALIDITVGNEGCLYLVDGGYTTNGRVRRMCPTGMEINERSEMKFSIYPNPSKGVFTINVNADLVGATLKMTDLSGRMVYSQNLFALTNSFDFDQNVAGVYMIEISKDGKSSTQKIIIE